MAISTGAAILGSAVIGGIASNAAAKKANKAAREAAAANNALVQGFSDRAYATIDPYLQSGYAANDMLTSMILGAPAGQQAGQPNWNQYLADNPDAATWVQSKAGSPDVAGKSTAELAAMHYQLDGSRRDLPTYAAPAQNPMLDPNGYGPAIAPRPVMSRPGAPALDISLNAYEKSPDYEFQLSEGNKNILANKGALGRLESGDAMKALQTFGQNVALGDYSQWRAYTTGQRNFEAQRGDQNFNFDASRSDANWTDDRNYATNRFDRKLADLFNLSGVGLNAAGTAIGVGQNATNAMMGNNNSAASARGNAAIAGANGLNQMLGAGLNYLGQQQGYGGGYGGYSTGSYGTPPIVPNWHYGASADLAGLY